MPTTTAAATAASNASAQRPGRGSPARPARRVPASSSAHSDSRRHRAAAPGITLAGSANRSPFSLDPGRRRPLRELLPEGRGTGGRPRDLDPPHRPQAARRGADRRRLDDLVRRRSPAPDRGQAPGRSRRGVGPRQGLHPRRRLGDRPGAGAGDGRGRRRLQRQLEPPVQGQRRPAPSLPRASGCTSGRCRGRSCSARIRAPASTGSSRSTANGSPSRPGRAWSATTGAPSTPRAGSGSMAPTIGDDGSRGYVDIGAGRVKLGPVLTPWAINGEIMHRGERLRVGGLGRQLKSKVDAQPTRCSFTVAGEKLLARGSVTAPAIGSSPGSTPTRSAPSTTPSTARSPISWSTSSGARARTSRSGSTAAPATSSGRAGRTTASPFSPSPTGSLTSERALRTERWR